MTWQRKWCRIVPWLVLLPCLAVGPIGRAAEEAGLDSIRVPPGFIVEVAAAPPLVERPMLASFDDRGRLYVADSAGVNLRGAELSKNPPHVIRMLEDTDQDGRFDKSTVFADKMIFPQGVVWHDGAVYCSSPPSFWRLQDTDGDGVADKREELVTGFANTGVADDMHGGSLGPDGRLYWCAGRFPHSIHRPGGPVIHEGTAPLVLRCRPDGSQLEVVCGSQGNAVGVAFTSEGDMFASGTFLAPNSMGAGLRDALVHCVDGAEYPVRDRVLNEHKRTGDVLPPLTHLGVSASSDLMICRGGQLGESYRGDLFSALFNMHKIMRHKIERNGATFACRNEDFLVSSDANFHPTDVFEDADGSLLVIDTGAWFRIGCPTSQISKPSVLGAIYRVRKQGYRPPSDPRGLNIAWQSLSAMELTALLSDPRFEVRDHAVAQLAKSGKAAVPALAAVLAGSAHRETKCAAVWALTRIDGAAARAPVRGALGDRDAGVRQAAARSTGLWRDEAAESLLARLVADDEPNVRREAATALGRLGRASAVPKLLSALALGVEGDRFLEHAVIFALITLGDRPGTLEGLKSPHSEVRRGALVALDQMDNGGLTADMVTPFLSPGDPLLRQTALWVISHHDQWGEALRDDFRARLSGNDATDEASTETLKQQLLAFAKDPAIQQLLATTLADAHSDIRVRRLVLEVIAQAPAGGLPECWKAPLGAALTDKNWDIVRQAIATLRALPLDKRPVISRVDARVDFALVDKRFAGTRLSQDFCARWSGIVRCPVDATYQFFTESDDGSQLFIDDKLVVDNGGAHAMRERAGEIQLSAGDHSLRLDFVQGEGEAGLRLSWAFQGRDKEVIPAAALFHRPRAASPSAAELKPGLTADFYELGGSTETFPNLAATEFDEPLLAVAGGARAPLDVRAQAAAAVSSRLARLDSALFEFLIAALDAENPPLVRMDAADALGRARLDESQLTRLCSAVATGGVLELPKLITAFERSHDAAIGRQLVAALGNAPGLKSLQSEQLASALGNFPDDVRAAAEPLVKTLSAGREKQAARLNELGDVLAGGEIQRGRELFFANKKAICATCHTIQGQGGKIGPDLSKIGAIRAPRDLLEAIVFPSASFARGYEPFAVATSDGQVHTGIIGRETADAVYLVNSNRVEVRIERAAIESLRQAAVSIMPEGMDAQLSRQDLADLIAFLQSLR